MSVGLAPETLETLVRLVSQRIREANSAIEAYRQIGDPEAERLETEWRKRLTDVHGELLAAGARGEGPGAQAD